MRLDDDTLRGAYRGETARAGGARSDCPESDALARAAAGELDDSDRRRVAEHLAVCSDCSEEIQLARPFPPAFRPAFVWRPVLLAALLLLAVGGVFVVRRAGRSPEGAQSGERGPVSKGETTNPGDGGFLSEPPSSLAWPSAPEAEQYEVVLYDAESRVIWRSGTSKEPRATVPPDIRERLVPNGRYLWRVRYTSGFDTRESPVFRFTLQPAR